jgi:hypothetical protein
MASRSIVLIGQSNFSVAWRSENGGNDLMCNVLIGGAHPYHRDKVDFEDEVFHGGAPRRINTAPPEVVQLITSTANAGGGRVLTDRAAPLQQTGGAG